MAFEGQPVPSTTHQHGYARVGDGKSIRVTVPPNSGQVKAGELVYFDGFIGFAVRGEPAVQELPRGVVLEDSDQPQVLILNIEQAVYQTDKINPMDSFDAGNTIYWDVAEKRLTTTPTLVQVGRVTNAKDANGVIEFRLGDQKDDSSGNAELAASTVRMVRFEFDATEGVDIGAHGVGVAVPDNAIILDGIIDVITTFTDGDSDSATIAIHVESPDDLVAAKAISDGSNIWDAGLHATIPVGTAATAIKTTDEREITVTVAEAALTAGKLIGFLQYVVSA